MPGSILAWTLFLGSMAVIGYILVGYPILLALHARFRGKPVRRQKLCRPVTVIIPVRNGDRWMERKIESVLAQDYPRDLLEVIVVSDGSTDATERIVRSYAGRGVRLLTLPHGGKPAALNAAVPHAGGEFLFLTDVRQVLAADCLKRLMACMADPAVGAVSGNLLIRKGENMEEYSTGLYWRYENWIRRNLSCVDSMLGATGPVYLIRRELYVPIPADTLLDDVRLPMTAHLKGYRLLQEEDAIAIDEPTNVISEYRRKVRTQAGVVQFLATFPGLFSSRCRLRLAFVNLKIGRLLLPYLLAVMFISSLFLPDYWKLMAIPQAAFWLVALADRLLPRESLLKNLTAPAGLFAALVVAALLAWKVLFIPPRQLWVETRMPRG